ncbi:MAG: agmatinase [Desulfobacteraceae bacterium]
MSQLRPGMVTVIGLPWDENSSFMQGPALAPSYIRETLKSGSTNLCSESEIDLGADPRFLDLGDMELAHGDLALEQIEKAIAKLLEKETLVLALGGDHAVTYPILKAYGKKYDKLNILHLDAHPDLYDEFEGNRYANACPFARIMEENFAVRLVQVGVRTMNPHQRKQAERFGVEVIEMRQWQLGKSLYFEGPSYLSLDMDVLDPAFAPGVSHPEAGGLSTRDVLTLIQSLRMPILGADIVELNPKRDPLGITAVAAAKLLKEIAARMLEPGGPTERFVPRS